MINILISVDSNYLDKARTMLFSMRRHTAEDISVYMLNHSLSENEIQQFAAYLKEKCRMQLHTVDTKRTALDNFPLMDGNIAIETYYRILAQFLLPDSLERVLWLDADIVVLNDISAFYHQAFDGAKYVVCPDSKCDSYWVRDCKEKLQLPAEHVYFNSGVMLMNLDALRQGCCMEDLLRQCELIKDRLTYHDQDILNYIYRDQVKYADWKKYNYQCILLSRVPAEDEPDIVILHYTGPDKPWNYWQIKNKSKYYWKVRYEQGDKWPAIKAYLKKIWEMTVLYVRELKDILP